jgi:hypothetical protein
MVENRTRGEQLFGKAKEDSPSSGDGKSLKGKIAGVIEGVRGLFSKPLIRAGAKPGVEAKTASALLPGALSGHKLDLKSINQILGLVLAGLIALTVYFAFGKRPNISSVTSAVSKIKFQDLGDETTATFQELAFYLDQIKKRDIFNEFEVPKPPPPVVKPKAPPPPPPPPKVMIQDKAKHLKLMGISWGSKPTAIIKDQSTQEVHFLGEGQKVQGTEINVKKILKEEVMISFEDQEMKML